MNTTMNFPNTFDEFAKDYGFKDKEGIYTNGSELITVFRVKQWLEHISSVTPQEPILGKIRKSIKALGEDMRICQKSITDEKVLIGFNMAAALCNKHLAESEE